MSTSNLFSVEDLKKLKSINTAYINNSYVKDKGVCLNRWDNNDVFSRFFYDLYNVDTSGASGHNGSNTIDIPMPYLYKDNNSGSLNKMISYATDTSQLGPLHSTSDIYMKFGMIPMFWADGPFVRNLDPSSVDWGTWEEYGTSEEPTSTIFSKKVANSNLLGYNGYNTFNTVYQNGTKEIGTNQQPTIEDVYNDLLSFAQLNFGSTQTKVSKKINTHNHYDSQLTSGGRIGVFECGSDGLLQQECYYLKGLCFGAAENTISNNYKQIDLSEKTFEINKKSNNDIDFLNVLEPEKSLEISNGYSLGYLCDKSNGKTPIVNIALEHGTYNNVICGTKHVHFGHEYALYPDFTYQGIGTSGIDAYIPNLYSNVRANTNMGVRKGDVFNAILNYVSVTPRDASNNIYSNTRTLTQRLHCHNMWNFSTLYYLTEFKYKFQNDSDNTYNIFMEFIPVFGSKVGDNESCVFIKFLETFVKSTLDYTERLKGTVSDGSLPEPWNSLTTPEVPEVNTVGINFGVNNGTFLKNSFQTANTILGYQNFRCKGLSNGDIELSFALVVSAGGKISPKTNAIAKNGLDWVAIINGNVYIIPDNVYNKYVYWTCQDYDNISAYKVNLDETTDRVNIYRPEFGTTTSHPRGIWNVF